MINRIIVSLLICTAIFTSCKKETRDLKEIEDTKIQNYLSSNNLTSQFTPYTVKNEGDVAVGVIYYQILKEGTDSLKYEDKVFYLQDIKALGGGNIAPYNGSVPSSATSSYLNSFIGYITPIGFQNAMLKAKLGGKVRAIIPSYLAYGKTGVGTQIGGNQILDITYEILKEKTAADVNDSLISRYIKTLPDAYTRDSTGVYYHIVNAGTGNAVTVDSTINAVYTGKTFDDKVFDSSTAAKPLEITLASLIPGWQYVLPKIKVGGKIKMVIPSYLAYGTSGSGAIPPNTPLYFEIELK